MARVCGNGKRGIDHFDLCAESAADCIIAVVCRSICGGHAQKACHGNFGFYSWRSRRLRCNRCEVLLRPYEGRLLLCEEEKNRYEHVPARSPCQRDVLPINSLQSAMTVEIFGVGSELLSVFGIVFTIGMLISTVVFPYLSERIRPRNLVIVPGICFGIVYAMLAFGGFAKGNLLLASIYCGCIALVMAVSVSWINATLSVQFMKKVDEDYLARAASLLNASGAAASPVVSFILTGVLVKVSVSSLFFAAGIAIVCIFIGMFVFRVQFDDVDEVGVPEMNEA